MAVPLTRAAPLGPGARLGSRSWSRLCRTGHPRRVLLPVLHRRRRAPLQAKRLSALEEARAAKRAAASYRTAGALPNAAASWTQAAQAYERAGNFGEAALAWTEAASLHEHSACPAQPGAGLDSLGVCPPTDRTTSEAIVALQAARGIAEHEHNTGLLAASLGQLGKASAALGQDDIALQFFTDAVTLARQEERAPLVAGLLNDLGNTLATQGNASDASRAYLESALLARGTGQSALSMTALINAAMASIDDGTCRRGQGPPGAGLSTTERTPRLPRQGLWVAQPCAGLRGPSPPDLAGTDPAGSIGSCGASGLPWHSPQPSTRGVVR